MKVIVIETSKPVEPELVVHMLDVDIAMLKNIRDKCGVVCAIKVCRLLVKGAGLKDAMDFVKGL